MEVKRKHCSVIDGMLTSNISYICIYDIYIIYIYIVYIYTYIYIYIYIYNAHTLFKSKIWNQQPGTYLGSQTARICSKKCIVWTEILLAEALAFNKCFLSEIRYMYKTKNLKAHYGITWRRAKLSKTSKIRLD